MFKKINLVGIVLSGMFVFGGCGYGGVRYEPKDLMMCRDGTISNYELNDYNVEVDTLNFNKDVLKDYFSDIYLKGKRD